MAGERTLPGIGLRAYWTAGSNGWQDEHDPDTRTLSVLVQCSVLSRVASVPGSPTDGDIHILTSAPNQHSIAARDNGAWVYYAPQEGWRAYDKATNELLIFDGSAWVAFTSGAENLADLLDVDLTGLATNDLLRYNGTAFVNITQATLKTDLGLTGTNSGDQTITLTGDVTGSGTGSFSATIANDAVTFEKMENIASGRILGRISALTGDIEGLTSTEATSLLNLFSPSLKGLVPASGGGTTNFLRADGSWEAPPSGGGVSDGDKGDIVVSGSGATWTVDAAAITLAKMADIAANSIIGNNTGSAATPVALSVAEVKTLLALTLDELSDVAITSPATGQVLRYNGSEFVNSAGEIVLNTQTGNYTLVLADAGRYVRMNVGSANTLTVPPNSSVAFPVGTIIQIRQAGAGQTTIVEDSGVTVNEPFGGTLLLAGVGASAALVKVGTDEWDLTGQVEAV